jgi:hypothetical protein
MDAPEHPPSPPVAEGAKATGDEIEEIGPPSDAEVAGKPPTEELKGFKAWWAKWGFEVKLIFALLLPVFVEVIRTLPFLLLRTLNQVFHALLHHSRPWITLLLLALSPR